MMLSFRVSTFENRSKITFFFDFCKLKEKDRIRKKIDFPEKCLFEKSVKKIDFQKKCLFEKSVLF